jgi:hypothetical protein
MTDFIPLSQWECLLKNSGTWLGSFTRLAPNGQVISDTPTVVSLHPSDDGKTMRQTVQRHPGQAAEEPAQTFEYRSLSRSILFFNNGEFSQGSMQYGPFSQFGAEFGFIEGDRRLRMVQLFNTEGHLDSMTLIREQRQGSTATERPALTVEQLIGLWRGEAITLYADLRSPTTCRTTLSIKQEGDRLCQTLLWRDRYITSEARIEGSILRFTQGSYPIQLILLPDGASGTTPLKIPTRRSFFLEVGWLVRPDLRQRLIRSYDDRGGWMSLTLVTEWKE